MLEEPPEQILARLDGWAQAVAAGLGSDRDKHTGITFRRQRRIQRQETDALYTRNALIARVCDLKVDTALREGWTFKGDSWEGKGAEFKERLEDELNLTESVRETIKLGNRYGFAAQAIPTDAAPEYPMSLQRVTKLFPCFTLSGGCASEIMPLTADSDMGSSTFKKVLMYQVTPMISGGTLEMHRSHLHAYEPIAMPYGSRENQDGLGMGPSLIDRLFEPMSRYGAAHGHAQALLYVASIMFLQLDGWAEDYRKPGGPAKLKAKIAEMSKTLSVHGMLGLDVKDKLGTAQHSVAGAFELVDRMSSFLGAHVDMPREILFNESPTGLRGGELSGPQALWYGQCADERTSKIEPRLKRVIKLAANVWGYTGKCEFEWPALWQETEKELADRYKSNADADRVYFELGAASAEEIREDRLIRGNMGPLRVMTAEIDPADTTSEDIELPDIPFETSLSPAGSGPADEALAAGQITALVDIIERAAAGTLPRDSAAAVIAVSFPAHAHNVEALLGSAGVQPALPEGEQDDPTADIPDDLLSVQAAAKRFGNLSTTTITNMIRKGKLTYYGFGAHKQVSLAEVAAAAKEHEQQPDPEPDPMLGS